MPCISPVLAHIKVFRFLNTYIYIVVVISKAMLLSLGWPLRLLSKPFILLFVILIPCYSLNNVNIMLSVNKKKMKQYWNWTQALVSMNMPKYHSLFILDVKNVFFSLISVYEVDQWSPTLHHYVFFLLLFPPGWSQVY